MTCVMTQLYKYFSCATHNNFQLMTKTSGCLQCLLGYVCPCYRFSRHNLKYGDIKINQSDKYKSEHNS